MATTSSIFYTHKGGRELGPEYKRISNSRAKSSIIRLSIVSHRCGSVDQLASCESLFSPEFDCESVLETPQTADDRLVYREV